jgi:hypothetical protein
MLVKSLHEGRRFVLLLLQGLQSNSHQSSKNVDSKGFQQLCITLRITGFLDFVHRPVF